MLKNRGSEGSSSPVCSVGSRLACVEALDDETAETLCGFFERARIWFRSIGIAVDEVTSDNGANFRSRKFAAQLARHAIAHTFTRPYRPQTNGKAERFNRTLTDEFLYNYKFRSETDRRRRLQTWVHHYDLHRHHTATGGTPASRVHSLYGSTTSYQSLPTRAALAQQPVALQQEV